MVGQRGNDRSIRILIKMRTAIAEISRRSNYASDNVDFLQTVNSKFICSA